MKVILNFQSLFPVVVLLLHAFIILFLCIYLLRKVGILKNPLSGLEYSHAIFGAITIFSVLLISTAGATALFQTFKTFQNQGNPPWQLYLSKSGEYFLVILFFEVLLALIILLFTRTFLLKGNGIKDMLEGSIPSALVFSAIVLGFAIVLRVMAIEVLQYITPQYLNFR